MAMGPLRDLGPCQVWYGDTPANIGNVFGTVTMRFTQEDADVFEAAYGRTPVDSVCMGSGPTEVTVPFTRLGLADLAAILPGGSNTSASGNVNLTANAKVGTSQYDNAAELILKPIVDGSVSAELYWLHIPKAYPRADYEITYDTETGQRIFNTVFKGFPDASTGITWRIGAA